MNNVLLNFEEEQRVAYLSTMATLAMADGEVDKEEADLLKEMCAGSSISEKGTAQVVKAMYSPKDVDLTAEMGKLTNSELRFSLAADMLMLMYADGEITDDEKKEMAALQLRMNLSESQFATLGKYVDAVQTFKKEGVSDNFLEKTGLADDFKKHGIPTAAFNEGKTVGEVVSKIAVGVLEKKLEGTQAGSILAVAKGLGLFNGIGKKNKERRKNRKDKNKKKRGLFKLLQKVGDIPVNQGK